MLTRKMIFSICTAALLFSACEKKEEECNGTATKAYDLNGFSRITAGSIMRISIQKGTSFSIQAAGCRRDIEDLRLRIVSGQTLEIDFDRSLSKRDAVDIDITVPELYAVNLSGASEGRISGFTGGTSNLRIVLSGASQATLDGTTIQTQIDLSGASELTANGTTDKLYGNLSGASELHAFTAAASEVDIDVSGGSKAYVRAEQKLLAHASGGSRIVYKGNPAEKVISTSGGGQVVQE